MKNFFSKIYYQIKYKIKSFNPFLIATLGRSGTWYNREFFFFYNKILSGEEPSKIIENMIKNKTKIKYLVSLNPRKFNYNSVFIQHFLCPGFEINYNGNLKKKWDNLVFYSKHIPAKYTDIMLKKNVDKKVNPYLNKDSKVIYYYRNPLDQAVAYFKTIQTHLDEDLKYYYDTKTKKKELFNDVHDFLRKAGIDMYLKHFLSFKLTQNVYPKNILMLSYENMVNNQEENFLKVLEFINHKVDKEAFSKAIKLSSKDSIIKLENAYGGAISQTYKYNTDRQLRDAKIGKWKNQITDDDIKYIEKRFNEFEMSINSFILE